MNNSVSYEPFVNTFILSGGRKYTAEIMVRVYQGEYYQANTDFNLKYADDDSPISEDEQIELAKNINNWIHRVTGILKVE